MGWNVEVAYVRCSVTAFLSWTIHGVDHVRRSESNVEGVGHEKSSRNVAGIGIVCNGVILGNAAYHRQKRMEGLGFIASRDYQLDGELLWALVQALGCTALSTASNQAVNLFDLA